MAPVSAPRSSSPPRNRLLAAMSATDLALLTPHLRPVALDLLKDLEPAQPPDRDCLFYGRRHCLGCRRPTGRDAD